MTLDQIKDLRTAVRDWKTTGRSAKYPMPVHQVEALIAAAIKGLPGQSFKDAMNGVQS